MKSRARALVALAGALGVAVIGAQAQPRHAPLDEPLTTTNHIIYAPAGEPLKPSDAGEFGLLTRLSSVAGVPFGFETDAAAPRTTSGADVDARDFTAKTLREALDGLVALDGRYEWRDLDGVVVVRARAAWSDPRDPLNQRVKNIDWHDLDQIAAINQIARLFFPNADRDPFEGMRAPRVRTFDVKVADGTILDVLNTAAQSDGQLGWAVSFGSLSSSPFSLTLGHYGIGPTANFTSLPTR
jgi:hypothetical protein